MDVRVVVGVVLMMRHVVVVELVRVRVVRRVVYKVRHYLAHLELVNDRRQDHDGEHDELLDSGDAEQCGDQEAVDGHQLDHDHERDDDVEVATARLRVRRVWQRQARELSTLQVYSRTQNRHQNRRGRQETVQAILIHTTTNILETFTIICYWYFWLLTINC